MTILIVCDADEDQLRMWRAIWVLFEGVSVSHINRKKSLSYPINAVPNMEILTTILGGKVDKLLTTYLGMPLGAKAKSKNNWNTVIESVKGN